jgi:anti-sigma regulatory factor (Ser/Thr protein kinase)
MQTGEKKPVSLTIASDPKHLAEVRKHIGHITESAGFDHEERERIKLAVDEAITNVIRHCYKNAPDKEIQITMTHDEDAVRIAIRDFGPKPDLSKLVSRKLEDVRPGGLGCYFIRQIMDEVTYDITSHEVGTELKLVKFKKSQPKG